LREFEPFALRVMHDSMEPEFKDGCIIIIDSAASVESGSCVFMVKEHIFRQFHHRRIKAYLRAPQNKAMKK
jgi:SOS-response transcriptional repressor LexA